MMDLEFHKWSLQFAHISRAAGTQEAATSKLSEDIKDAVDFLLAGRLVRSLTQAKALFQSDFKIDGESLDIHDYDANMATVPLKLVVDRCKESSALPFYYPWLLLDEADVVLVDVGEEKEVEERLGQGCPAPSRTNLACLIFVRAGQIHNNEKKLFVYSKLLEVMERRHQKFVLVTAWQEIWCTPYCVQHKYALKKPKEWFVRIREEADKILASPLLVAWFGKNLCIHHPKLHPVPLGAKREPNSIRVSERQFKTEFWVHLDGHRPRHSFLHKEKTNLLAAPMFEISTTGSPAFSDHKFYRERLMEVSSDSCGIVSSVTFFIAFGENFWDKLCSRSEKLNCRTRYLH
jgi:hypothetical protein